MPFIGRDRTLFRLFGLPIRANASWLFLVALVVASLAQGYFPGKLGPRHPWYVYWGMASLGAALLFASLLAHELCHSLVARATGMPVSGITLFIFGGVSQLEEEPATAWTEFLMAAVGPLSSVVLGIGFFVLWLAGFLASWPAAVLALLSYLSFINFLLATFNSVPAFPLDGGRVLRSVLWGITGDLRLATHVAARIGSLAGFGLIVMGAMLVLTGGSSPFAGIWLAVIGFFLRQAAAGSLQMVVMRESLRGESVWALTGPGVVTVSRATDLRRFVDDYVFGHRLTHYPVVDEAGQLVGLVSARAPGRVPRSEWPYVAVGEVMTPVTPDMVISADMDAADALPALRRLEGQPAVVVADGRPVGLIGFEDLLRFLALKTQLGPRPR